MISVKNIPVYMAAVFIVLLLTLFTNEFGFIGSPVILTTAVITFSALLLNRVKLHDILQKPAISAMLVLLFVLLNVLMVYAAYLLFQKNPINAAYSDIIPLIKDIYIKRLLSGETVYSTIEGYGYGVWYPNYLPMHWLPCVPAYVFGFDPRYIGLAVLLLANLYYFITILHFKLHIAEAAIKVVFPFLVLFILFQKYSAEVANSVELLTAGFYFFLGMVLLNNKNGVFKAIALFFTSMSRFVVLFILPAIFITDFKQKIKGLRLAYTLFFVLVLFGYVLPFLQTDALVFFKGTKAYNTAALGEWKGQSWQNPGDRPFQLFRGFGFASWFYTYGTANLENKINLNKTVLLVIMLVNLIVWLFANQLVKNKNMLQPVMLFFSLYVFFAFVLVPYNYLFWNVLFIIPVLLLPVKLLNVK